MKRLCIKILFLGALFLLHSCYKDKSTFADKKIPDIIIEGIEPVMNVYYGHEIEIEAKVRQEGGRQVAFTYLWEIDLEPGSMKNRIELSNTPSLKYSVANSPSDKPYMITLTVMDPETGLSKVAGCKLYVSSSLGEGLLVAYTRDKGLTSDIDIVSSKAVTFGYNDNAPRYTRGLYSFANGKSIEGKVNTITDVVCSNTALYNMRKIMVGTENHIFAIEPLTFKLQGIDSDQFNVVQESSFGTSSTFNFAAYISGAIVNGSLYGITCNSEQNYNKITYPNEPGDIFTPSNVAYAKLDQGKIAVFDENMGKFYYMPGWMFMTGAFQEIEKTFDVDFKGAKSIGAGGTKNSNLGYMIKDSAGKYHICVLSFPYITEVLRYDLEGEGLDDIVSVAFCDNADLVYYATESKVYCVILSGGKASVHRLSWSPDSHDERITSLKHYQQAWYGTRQYHPGSYEFILPSNRMQILITTYNEKTGEGKIYLKPFNVSTGMFQFKDNGEFVGFGEITSIGMTFK